MTAMLILFMGFFAWGQPFQFELNGSFKTHDDVTVNYEIDWNESSDSIQGLYEDNYYTLNFPHLISGEIDSEGRKFTVIFPDEVNGVRSIKLATPHTSSAGTSIPMSIQTQDDVGSTLRSVDSFGIMNTNFLTETEDNNCTVGFGALAGYCGIYQGIVTEVVDSANNCSLQSAGGPRLELVENATVKINFVNLPSHNLGSLPPSPLTANIDLTRDICRGIPGTNFPIFNCKTMNLTGFFTQVGLAISFNGTYSIMDKETGQICNYNLTLNRETVY